MESPQLSTSLANGVLEAISLGHTDKEILDAVQTILNEAREPKPKEEPNSTHVDTPRAEVERAIIPCLPQINTIPKVQELYQETFITAVRDLFPNKTIAHTLSLAELLQAHDEVAKRMRKYNINPNFEIKDIRDQGDPSNVGLKSAKTLNEQLKAIAYMFFNSGASGYMPLLPSISVNDESMHGVVLGQKVLVHHE